MEESYIKDYIITLMDQTYTTDTERLKAINYAIDFILEKSAEQLKTQEYNQLTTCYLTIKKIIEEKEEEETIPNF